MGNRVSDAGETRTVTVGEVAEEDRKRNNTIRTSKYTLLSFIPKNLVEQFRRIANFYFLIVSVIAVLIDSPVSPITSLAPLVFVIAVTMAKQGYEDWLRHRVDYSVNNELVTVIRNSTIQQIKSSDIRPGEVVRVSRDCDVPCDAVLLWSSDSRGKCFVTTANLDGETSLKPLKVPASLADTVFADKSKEKITVEVLQPDVDIYTFYGKLVVDGGTPCPLSAENLLLRGSRVKNTEWAICCATYTGADTKLALNSRFTSNKFTSAETYINNFLLFFVILMLVELVVSFFLKRYWEGQHEGHDYYLGPNTSSNSFRSIAQDLFSFLLLYYYCIPISLYVTIEMQKFIGSLFFEWDVELVCPETQQPALANSSDLNEELGQIEILFSDKTGTLTKNDMYFQMCSVKGELYIEKDKRLYEMSEEWTRGETVQAVEVLNPDLQFFFTVLALCHTVQVEETPSIDLAPGKMNQNNNFDVINEEIPRYQAMSSDEIAFVRAAANRGIVFYGEESNKLCLKTKDGQMETYEKLQVLEFTSARRRMSVVVRNSSGKIWLFCKGAESAVLPLCGDGPLVGITDAHVQTFAEQGLRTLAVAYKELTEEQYVVLNEELTRRNLDIHGRHSGVDGGRVMEEGLTLLGATGVEDRLQDCVAETLESLRVAGIKIWVLTGDKVETAINVAQSCGHIPSRSEKLFLVEVNTEESLDVQLEQCLGIATSGSEEHFTLVVDGQSIALVLDTPKAEIFVKLSLMCEAVICCRLSPLQKAQIVRLIKKSPGKPITAAIGDGANDISMIQEAHVGFGIFGREGRQAARCADFAFTKFMMLKRVLLVHGHWFYQRLGTLVQYFFYKNLLFVNTMIFFQIHSGFSTQSIFDSMFLTFYNLFFTSAPILVLSLSEQCHSQELLMRNPLLYKKQVTNKVLSWTNFFGWCWLGIYHSVVIFYFLYEMWDYNPVMSADGKPSGLWCFGVAIIHCIVCVVNLKVWLIARYQSNLFIICVVLSILVFVGLSATYSSFYIIYDGDVLGTYTRLLGSLSFWLSTSLIMITCLWPDYTFLAFKSMKKRLASGRNDDCAMQEITRL